MKKINHIKSFLKSKTFFALLVGLLVFRLLLPTIVLNYLNKSLANLDGYYGSIEGVDISLIRGAYSIHGLILYSEETPNQPILKSEVIDLSVEWKSIIKGAIVGEVQIYNPVVEFIAGINKKELNNYEKIEDAGWREVLKGLFPLRINRLDIINGEVHYKDIAATPKVDVVLDQLSISATNLSNTNKITNQLSSNIKGEGYVMSSAKISLKTSLNPLDTAISFISEIEMEELHLKDINNYLDAYLNIDAEKGTISAYSQINVNKGFSEGYVKPLVKDADFLSLKGEDKNDAFWDKIREGSYDVSSKILDNNKRKQLASKIVFSGDLNSPNINVFKSITSFLSNAFISAIKPGLEPNLIKK